MTSASTSAKLAASVLKAPLEGLMHSGFELADYIIRCAVMPCGMHADVRRGMIRSCQQLAVATAMLPGSQCTQVQSPGSRAAQAAHQP